MSYEERQWTENKGSLEQDFGFKVSCRRRGGEWSRVLSDRRQRYRSSYHFGSDRQFSGRRRRTTGVLSHEPDVLRPHWSRRTSGGLSSSVVADSQSGVSRSSRGGCRLHQHQTLAEVTTGDNVDDEIHRRVENDEQVADSGVVVMPVAAGASLFVHKSPQDVVDKFCWRFSRRQNTAVFKRNTKRQNILGEYTRKIQRYSYVRRGWESVPDFENGGTFPEIKAGRRGRKQNQSELQVHNERKIQRHSLTTRGRIA